METQRSSRGAPTSWPVRHRSSLNVIALGIILLGVVALGSLKTEFLPHRDVPLWRVQVAAPGLPASVLEEKITQRLEEDLAKVNGVVSVESATTTGNTEIDLRFARDADAETRMRDISSRLEGMKSSLPDIDPPVILQPDTSSKAMQFVITSTTLDLSALRDWIDATLTKQFLDLSGVSTVEMEGGVIHEVLVQPDQRRLAGFGLSFGDLVRAIKKGNSAERAPIVMLPKSRKPAARTPLRPGSVSAVGALPVSLPGGESISLSEVARIVPGEEGARTRVRFNGVEGIKVAVGAQRGVDASEISGRVRAHVDWMRANSLIPEGVTIHSFADRPPHTGKSLRQSALALAIGALLVVLLTYLLSGSSRRALTSLLVILVSVQAAFAILAVTGYSLNHMTLGGLVLGVGLFSVNTIYLFEERGLTLAHPDVVSTGSYSPAIVGSLCVLASLLPLLLAAGEATSSTRPLIFSFFTAFLVSLLAALALVPALAPRSRRSDREPWHERARRMLASVRHAYGRLVSGILRYPVGIAATSFLLFIAVAAVLTTRQENVPPGMDDGRIVVEVTSVAPLSAETFDGKLRQLEEMIRQQGGVDSYVTTVENESLHVFIAVQLAPAARHAGHSRVWAGKFQTLAEKTMLPGMEVSTHATDILPGRSGIRLIVEGTDQDQLATIGDALVKRIKSVPGVRHLRHSAKTMREEFSVRMDEERAHELGIDMTDIGRAMGIAASGIIVGNFRDSDRRYEIRLRLPVEETNSEALGRLLLLGELKERPAVHLRDVASLAPVHVPAKIRRIDQRPIVEVSVGVDPTASPGEVMRRIQNILADYKLPAGYKIYFRGAGNTLETIRANSLTRLGLALLFVFAVLLAHYRSWRNPVLILLSTLTALMGAGLGFLASGLPLSLPVWLGFTLLTGFASYCGFVFVEYVEARRPPGQPANKEIMEAAKRRFRLLMTMILAPLAGMLPLAFGFVAGAEFLQQIAMVVVIGLVAMLPVTLLCLPALYHLIRKSD
ncbi:MAG: efflux RND transporter permease subunit [Pseudomonadota bacterium]